MLKELLNLKDLSLKVVLLFVPFCLCHTSQFELVLYDKDGTTQTNGVDVIL